MKQDPFTEKRMGLVFFLLVQSRLGWRLLFVHYPVDGLLAELHNLKASLDVLPCKGQTVIARVLGGEVEAVDLPKFIGDLCRNPVLGEVVPEVHQPVQVMGGEYVCDLLPVSVRDRDVFIDQVLEEPLAGVLGYGAYRVRGYPASLQVH